MDQVRYQGTRLWISSKCDSVSPSPVVTLFESDGNLFNHSFGLSFHDVCFKERAIIRLAAQTASSVGCISMGFLGYMRNKLSTLASFYIRSCLPQFVDLPELIFAVA